MEAFLITLQILVGLLIVLIVLINVTKGSEYGAVFRGAEVIFGGAGPTNFLNKVTMILVIVFFLNSLLLTKVHTEKHKTSLHNIPIPKATENVTSPVIPSSQEIPVPPKTNTFLHNATQK